MRLVTTFDRLMIGRPARRLKRVVGGLIRPSTRPRYVTAIRQLVSPRSSRGGLESCLVCGSLAAQPVTVTETGIRASGMAPGKTFTVRVCRVCQHVSNPENVHDYRAYEAIEKLPDRARIGTAERKGREFYIAEMAIDILERREVDVLVFGAGRSLDNHHIAALPGVRHVAVADVMKLRDDAEFIDANLPPPRRFDVVVASEVVEHFLDPRRDIAHLLGYVEPDGILVCSTNIYDGGSLSRQHYLFLAGHTSYYSAKSLTRLAEASGHHIDFRIPLVATGYGGPRKRYVIFSMADAVMDATARYFKTHRYAPSESPTANTDLAAARKSAAAEVAHPTD